MPVKSSTESALEIIHGSTFDDLEKKINRGIAQEYRNELQIALREIWNSRMLFDSPLVKGEIVPSKLYYSYETGYPLPVYYDVKFRPYILTSVFISEGGYKRNRMALKVPKKRWCVFSNVGRNARIRWSDVQKTTRTEIAIHKSLSHPNIVKLVHGFEGTDIFHLITPFCKRENLDSYQSRHPKGFSYHEVVSLTQQLVNGLMYLKRKKIIHNDIKSANLFLKRTNRGFRLKIGDFGLAERVEKIRKKPELCGSVFNFVPEQTKAFKEIVLISEAINSHCKVTDDVSKLSKEDKATLHTLLKKYDNPARIMSSSSGMVWQAGIVVFKLLNKHNINFVMTAQELTPTEGYFYFIKLKQDDINFELTGNNRTKMLSLCMSMLRINPKERIKLKEVSNFMKLECNRIREVV